MDWGGSWEQYLALAKFAYNNSFQASIGMPPFEALYGRPCRSPLCWEEPGDRAMMSSELIQECNEKVPLIRQRLLTTTVSRPALGCCRLKLYMDNRANHRCVGRSLVTELC